MFYGTIHFNIIAIVAAIALVGGCDKKGNGGGAVSEVRLGYFANVTHAQAVLGDASGEFEQAIAPAKLVRRPFNAGPSLIEALFAGEIDIGYIGPGPAINAHERSRGKGVRIIAGAAANGVLIVARKDAGIEKLADLKGKTIATPQYGNTQDISARHYVLAQLKQANADNVRPIANAQQAAMLSAGQIDAAWVPEPWGSRLVIESGAKLIAHEKDVKQLWPGGELNLTVVITTPEFLAQHGDIVEKMLRVHRSWTARLQKDPGTYREQLGAALFKMTGTKLPPGVLDGALANVKFTDDPLEGTLKSMAEWSYELKIARQPASVEGLVDLTILRKLQQAGN